MKSKDSCISSSTYQRLLLYLCFLAFISLGLPDGLLGVAWPSISGFFGVPISNLAVLQIAFTIGYLLSSTNAGRLTRRLGVGNLLIASNLSAAAAMTGYVYASLWPVLVGATIVLGTAGGAVDAALNAYAAGRFRKEQVTLLHAFYGFGAMLGPVIMRGILKRGGPWQRGYLTTLILVGILLVLFILSRHFWYRDDSRGAASTRRKAGGAGAASLCDDGGNATRSDGRSSWSAGDASRPDGRNSWSVGDPSPPEDGGNATRSEEAGSVGDPSPPGSGSPSGGHHPRPAGSSVPLSTRVVGISLFLFYTGLEVTVGAWSFSLFTAGRGTSPGTAALWVGIYWGALTGGRIFFGFFGSRWRTGSIVRIMLITLVSGTLMLLQPWYAPAGLVSLPLIGFACAPLFPMFVTLTPHIVGDFHAPDIIGLQVASASLGAAVIPGLVGAAVELSSIEAAAWVTLLLALLIAGTYRKWIRRSPNFSAGGPG